MKFAKLIALTALLLTVTLPVGAAGPTITMSPAPFQVPVGGVTPLLVKINNIQGLYGFDIKMKFDPTLVEVQDANPNTPTIELLPGDFLSYDIAPRNEADNVVGSTWIAVAQMNPHEAKDGSGALFTVYVKGKAAGRAAFEITEATFANRNGERIDVPLAQVAVEVGSGSASTSANPTPLPTAPAPQIDLTQAVEQAARTPAAPAQIEATAGAPAAATPAPAATAAAPVSTAEAVDPTATLAPAEVASPTSAAPAAAPVEAAPAPTTADTAAQAAQPAQATAVTAQPVEPQPTAAVVAKTGAGASPASAPAGLDAPTRVSTAAQQGRGNTLLFAGGGLLLLAAAGVVGLVVLRRGK